MQLSPEQQKAIEEQKQYCPFCKIVKGEIPATKVFEDNDFIAVLDINPGVRGHTLLVPKEHYPILPLMPPDQQQKLGSIASQLSASLKRSMLTNRVELFVANGAAAGQQSSHFLIHLLPSENKLFNLALGESEASKKLETVMRQRFGKPEPKDDLTKAIAEYPELKKMLVESPEEFVKNIHVAPDLEKLFRGVDIMKLSAKLREQAGMPPKEIVKTAGEMTDNELTAFINGKEKLRDLIVKDPATLEEALSQQPRLAAFFKGTTVAAVRARYLGGIDV